MTNDEYIRQHRDDDVRRLALAKTPEGVDVRWCLQQIEGRQLAQRKLPQWAATEGLHYPPHLALEQCSGEETALYKRRIVERLIPDGERTAMADLTGGLGVDFSSIAPLFREADYVEILPHLRQLAQHNFPLLGLPHARVAAPEHYQLSEKTLQLVYLDPARRDRAGRKTVGIEDCTPNLLEMQDEVLGRARWMMVKLSPMLDITEALRRLHAVREVHVVSVRGECKELLFVMGGPADAPAGDRPAVHCVNLGTDDDPVVLGFPFTGAAQLISSDDFCKKASLRTAAEGDGLESGCPAQADAGLFLYEPNASLLKAGVQDALCERYGVSKLHPQSHLFVGETFHERFPGRRFRIADMSDFSKRGVKRLIGSLRRANITVRNFPTDVASLRRQLKLNEGGDDYLFATTLCGEQRVLIRCRRV